mgnify:CR=1 FL=1
MWNFEVVSWRAFDHRACTRNKYEVKNEVPVLLKIYRVRLLKEFVEIVLAGT